MSEFGSDGLVSLSDRVRFRAVGEEGVVVHVESGRVVVLNATGLHVLRELEQGSRTPAQLAGSLAAEFAVEPAEASADVAAFLAELDAERILVHAAEGR